MSGNAYGNLCKYMIAHCKKVFKASTHSGAHQHQPQMTKFSLHIKNIKSLSKSQKNLKKMTNC